MSNIHSTNPNPVVHIGASIILLDSSDKILLGKRINVYGHGTWGLPGGHVEFCERLDNAVLREIYEETNINLTPQDLTFLGIVNQIEKVGTDKAQHYLQTVFLANSDAKPINQEPEYCESLQWFDLKNLPSPLFPPHISLIQILTSHELYSEAVIA